MLTYKVTLSAAQLTNSIADYLYRLYIDQLHIDVEKFAVSPIDSKLKTINAYLVHLGIPTVNKVCLSFKQLHMMRYS